MVMPSCLPRALVFGIGSVLVPWLVPMADAVGADLTFQPRVDVGIANYSLNFGSTAQFFPDAEPFGPGLEVPLQTSTTKLEFSDTLPTLSAGLTVFADRFYLDLLAQRAFNGSVSDSNNIYTATPLLQSSNRARYEGDMKRDDYAVALGYGVTDTVAVFAGWKWARTKLDGLRASGIERAIDGTPLGVLEGGGDFKFKYDGPFVGAAIGWPVSIGALDGSVGLNVAVAFLDGKVTVSSGFNSLDGRPLSPGPAEIFDTTGKTIGTLIGLSWRGSTGVQSLSYTVGVNGYRYSFDADDTGKADISETFVQLKVGLAYAF